MSKLLDRLERITRGPGRSLGFAPAGARETTPTLALIADLGDTPTSAKEALEGGADAVVVAGSSVAGGSLPEGSVWGAAVEGLDKAKADALQEQGADFLLFGLDSTQVAALEDGGCGRVLRLAHDLEELKMRCIEDLPVDVVVVSKPGPDGPLSLAHILAVSNVRSATSGYLLLEWDRELGKPELEQLRGMGVDGILLSGKQALSLVPTLRERIDGLPPRKPRTERDQRSAVLPRVEVGGRARPAPVEPDEDDDDDWNDRGPSALTGAPAR